MDEKLPEDSFRPPPRSDKAFSGYHLPFVGFGYTSNSSVDVFFWCYNDKFFLNEYIWLSRYYTAYFYQLLLKYIIIVKCLIKKKIFVLILKP